MDLPNLVELDWPEQIEIETNQNLNQNPNRKIQVVYIVLSYIQTSA